MPKDLSCIQEVDEQNDTYRNQTIAMQNQTIDFNKKPNLDFTQDKINMMNDSHNRETIQLSRVTGAVQTSGFIDDSKIVEMLQSEAEVGFF